VYSLNYLQSVLALDALPLTADRRIPSVSAAPANPLVAAVNYEVEAAAALTALSYSLINRLIAAPTAQLVETPAVYEFARCDLPLTRASIPRLIDQSAPLELIEALVRLDQRLTLAGRLSASYGQQSTPGQTEAIDISILADAWSHAAKAAVAALGALASSLDRPTDPRLIELLGAVIAGQHPCVTPDGQISIPGWAELRRHRRVAVDFNIELLIGGTQIAARAENASSAGLGVTVLDPNDRLFLVPGAEVAVTISGKPALTGRIAWCAGSRAGIALNEPLEATRPT
jgi:hypothetical protein